MHVYQFFMQLFITQLVDSDIITQLIFDNLAVNPGRLPAESFIGIHYYNIHFIKSFAI